MPKRIQRRRTKGWRMPENTIFVGRPSKLGNPFKVIRVERGYDTWWEVVGPGIKSKHGSRKSALAYSVTLYRLYAKDNIDASEYAGFDICCWCGITHNGEYNMCHADVLISLANDIPLEDVIRENLRAIAGETLR
jgi:hypothetical protein